MITFIIILMIILTTLVFTNEKFIHYVNKDFEESDDFINIKPKNFKPEPTDKFYYERPVYRLPYRFPVGVQHDNLDDKLDNVHAYDINS